MSEVIEILCSDCDESPTQPRTKWGDMEALAAELRAIGRVTTPIIVRRSPSVSGRYELVDGARRKRGSEMAGLTTILAIVREYTAQADVEIEQVLSSHSEPLGAMDEGRVFDRLEREHHLPIAEIAARTGVNAATVAARIRLTRLIEPLRALVDADRLGILGAQLLAMLGEDVQESIADDIARLHPRDRIHTDDVRRLIDRHVRVLDRAPFDTTDATLTPTGSCNGCPSNTESQRDLFKSGGGMCTLPPCWATKSDAAWANIVRIAEASGVAVLSADDTALVLDGTRVRPGAKWVDVDSPIAVETAETWTEREKALAASSVDGQGFDLSKTAMARNGDAFFRLASAPYLAEFIAREYPDRARELRGEKNPAVLAEQEEKAKKKARAAIDLEARKRALLAFVTFATPSDDHDPALVLKMLRTTTLLALEAAGAATCGEVARRREVALGGEHEREVAPREALTRAAAEMDAKALGGLLMEVLIVRSLTDEESLAKAAHELLGLADVNLKKITKAVENEGRGVTRRAKKRSLPVLVEAAPTVEGGS